MNLADAMRPQVFEDIAGQEHLTDEKSLFMSLIKGGSFDSIMFVGPPGTGKTSMAEIVGKSMEFPVYKIHAATSGASDLKKLAERSLYESNIIVFIDEIHRYNKSQQDILLKLIDDRRIKLIGASAENPYFNLIPALRSRSLMFKFKPIDENGFRVLFLKASEVLKKMLNADAVNENGVFKVLADSAAGDGRRFLNLLEIAALTGKREGDSVFLSDTEINDILPVNKFSDDEFYDILSAMIKSVRGSDPDAALLWCFKLIKNGVTPEAIFRRLMISASEDVGNAYPDGQIFVNACYQSFMNVGIPEGYIILAHAVTFLASCPKSNRSYLGYHGAMKYLEENDPKVPDNICHNPKGYKYPFDYGNFVNQEYCGDDILFYQPSEYGFELKIKERLQKIWRNVKKYG